MITALEKIVEIQLENKVDFRRFSLAQLSKLIAMCNRTKYDNTQRIIHYIYTYAMPKHIKENASVISPPLDPPSQSAPPSSFSSQIMLMTSLLGSATRLKPFHDCQDYDEDTLYKINVLTRTCMEIMVECDAQKVKEDQLNSLCNVITSAVEKDVIFQYSEEFFNLLGSTCIANKFNISTKLHVFYALTKLKYIHLPLCKDILSLISQLQLDSFNTKELQTLFMSANAIGIQQGHHFCDNICLMMAKETGNEIDLNQLWIDNILSLAQTGRLYDKLSSLISEENFINRLIEHSSTFNTSRSVHFLIAYLSQKQQVYFSKNVHQTCWMAVQQSNTDYLCFALHINKYKSNVVSDRGWLIDHLLVTDNDGNPISTEYHTDGNTTKKIAVIYINEFCQYSLGPELGEVLVPSLLLRVEGLKQEGIQVILLPVVHLQHVEAGDVQEKVQALLTEAGVNV